VGKNSTDFIDDFFDDKENPKIDPHQYSFIGLMETLIDNSLFDENTKREFYERLDELRENDVSEFMYELKSNQKIHDPKHQYAEMVRRGVFN
jgi:hypothetical protein